MFVISPVFLYNETREVAIREWVFAVANRTTKSIGIAYTSSHYIGYLQLLIYLYSVVWGFPFLHHWTNRASPMLGEMSGTRKKVTPPFIRGEKSKRVVSYTSGAIDLIYKTARALCTYSILIRVSPLISRPRAAAAALSKTQFEPWTT